MLAHLSIRKHSMYIWLVAEREYLLQKVCNKNLHKRIFVNNLYRDFRINLRVKCKMLMNMTGISDVRYSKGMHVYKWQRMQ